MTLIPPPHCAIHSAIHVGDAEMTQEKPTIHFARVVDSNESLFHWHGGVWLFTWKMWLVDDAAGKLSIVDNRDVIKPQLITLWWRYFHLFLHFYFVSKCYSQCCSCFCYFISPICFISPMSNTRNLKKKSFFFHLQVDEKSTPSEKHYSFLDLLRTSNIRIISGIISLTWWVSSHPASGSRS